MIVVIIIVVLMLCALAAVIIIVVVVVIVVVISQFTVNTVHLLSCQRLHSACHQLIVPRHCRTKFGCRAFSFMGLTA